MLGKMFPSAQGFSTGTAFSKSEMVATGMSVCQGPLNVTVHDLTQSRHSCPRLRETLEKVVRPRGRKKICKNCKKRLTWFLAEIG
jgi:hypothetical protein